MRLKGISPIVASVLLIAFSTIIAAIVGTWAKSYTEAELTSLELCKDIDLVSLSFDYNSSTKKGSITVQNVGGPVSGYKLYAFVNEKQKEFLKEIKQTIPESQKTTISFETTLNNVRGITVEVIDCPGVRLNVMVS
jgi:flagellin-like protein